MNITGFGERCRYAGLRYSCRYEARYRYGAVPCLAIRDDRTVLAAAELRAPNDTHTGGYVDEETNE